MTATGSKGKLFLIPVTLGEVSPLSELSSNVLSKIRSTRFFIAENAKSARKFLKACELTLQLQDITVFEMDKHSDIIDFNEVFEPVRNGNDMGLMSEAGMPAIADPGSLYVKQAHLEGIEVVPLAGPSSIFLALAASGFNGQSFCFHGYLPKEKNERIEKIKQLETNSRKLKQTQIFIETPYRNNVMLEDLCSVCSGDTKLSVSVSLTLDDEQIITLPIAKWRQTKTDLNKRPAVFLILA